MQPAPIPARFVRRRLFTESPDAAEVNLHFVPFQADFWHGDVEIALPGSRKMRFGG